MLIHKWRERQIKEIAWRIAKVKVNTSINPIHEYTAFYKVSTNEIYMRLHLKKEDVIEVMHYFNVSKGVLIFIVLHEIAHKKQQDRVKKQGKQEEFNARYRMHIDIMSELSSGEAQIKYHMLINPEEIVANRYAKRYYKRFL